MKVGKLALALVCTALLLFGAVYNVVALPFSSPLFDLLSWVAIGIAALILFVMGRSKS